ncbi:hypothetical protein MKEN_00404800 [Mycena kentingensis (nom. inval.)]|nr:hypothetical protein MKEN_00404800 [Mycena kentingensis (nom. inval.)]
MAFSPPVLPPELTDIVINELSDSRNNLRNLSLVARSWLPASRHHLYASLTMRGEDIASFIAHLDAPHGTFARFLRALVISFGENGDLGLLATHLARFSCLERIRLRETVYMGHFAALPSLECLELAGVYFTEPSELTLLIRGFPKLKRLHLSRVSVWTPCAIDIEPLPQTLLDYVELDIQDETLLSWLQAVPASRVLASARAATPAQSGRISDYLVSVGPRLKELTFCFRTTEQPAAIEFGRFPKLITLRLVNSPALHRLETWDAYFRKCLPSLLQRLASKNTKPALQRLEIDVTIYSTALMDLPHSALDTLKALFASRKFESLRLVQFNVHCFCALHRPGTPEDLLREGELCVAQKAFRNQIVVPLGLDSGAEGMPECAILLVESEVRVT